MNDVSIKSHAGPGLMAEPNGRAALMSPPVATMVGPDERRGDWYAKR